MSFILQPWQLCLAILAGWINRQQQQIIEPGEEVGRHEGDVQGRERLGGLLHYYYREAA